MSDVMDWPVTNIVDDSAPLVSILHPEPPVTPREVVDALDLIIRWYREDKTGENWRVDVQQMESDRRAMAELLEAGMSPTAPADADRTIAEAALFSEVMAEAKQNIPSVAGSEGRGWWLTTAGSAIAVLLATDARAREAGR